MTVGIFFGDKHQFIQNYCPTILMMGRFPAPVACLNASAKRKPLSLKPERKNSPKKTPSKFVVFGDKENQTAAHGNQMAGTVSQQQKKSSYVTCADAVESEERAALRKKVEEAVAFHLANRSPPGTPLPAKAIDESNTVEEESDVRQSSEAQEGTECDADVLASNKSTRGQRVRVVLAVLLVLAMAVWSGIRVALLKPDNALVKYEPYVRQGVDFFVSKLEAVTARPDASYTVDEFVAVAMPSVEVDTVVVDISSESLVLETSVSNEEPIEMAVAEENDLFYESQGVEQTEAEVEMVAVENVDIEAVSKVVLQIAPPVGRAQLVLRKAFDILTPLKKVLAKVQDKFVHVMYSISRFFQHKTK